MGSAGLLVSELDWLSTSLDRDLATETLATLGPSSAAPDLEWDAPMSEPSRGDVTRMLARVASFLRGCPRTS